MYMLYTRSLDACQSYWPGFWLGIASDACYATLPALSQSKRVEGCFDTKHLKQDSGAD